jgi:hypothetical protein
VATAAVAVAVALVAMARKDRIYMRTKMALHAVATAMTLAVAADPAEIAAALR